MKIEDRHPVCGHPVAPHLIVTDESGYTERFRLPERFLPFRADARLCLVCERFVNPDEDPAPEGGEA